MGLMGGTDQQWGHYAARQSIIGKILAAEGLKRPEWEDLNHPWYRRIWVLGDMSDYELWRASVSAGVDSTEALRLKDEQLERQRGKNVT